MVVDASALIETLLRTPASVAVERRIFAVGEDLHAPCLIDVEAIQVLRRYAAAKDIDETRAQAALADLIDFPLRRYPHDWLLPRIWDLRGALSAYDAVYVALAEALDAPLLTRDRRLAAAHGHHAVIELV
jgi:predicted nucleic acid-binding protein